MGRILGLDYGDSRIGLATSDPNKIIASPLYTIQNRGVDKLKIKLDGIIVENDIESLVLGLPISMTGKDTIQTEKVREFSKFLECFNIPIHMQDERLSSLSAKKSLIEQNVKTGHNKHLIDSTAAAIFLQQFLDSYSQT
jgi:putative Holliday junction resolvase